MLGLSIVFAVILFCTMLAAERLTAGEKLVSRETVNVIWDSPRTVAYALLAISVGAIYFVLAKKYLDLQEWRYFAIIFALILVGWDGYLVYLWSERGSRFRELVPFAIVTWIIYHVSYTCAHYCATLAPESWGKVIELAPKIIAILMIAYYVVDIFRKSIEDHR